MMKPPFLSPSPSPRSPSPAAHKATFAPPQATQRSPLRRSAIPGTTPDAPYGSSNAIWRPPVYDLQQTIVKPAEPASQASRPDYEGAEWATGAGGGS